MTTHPEQEPTAVSDNHQADTWPPARPITMTPGLAKAILNGSPQIARPVSWREVHHLAYRMQQEGDDVMGHRVELDHDGHLVTGRRILLAVILADQSVRMTLIEDAETNQFTHYPPFAASLR